MPQHFTLPETFVLVNQGKIFAHLSHKRMLLTCYEELIATDNSIFKSEGFVVPSSPKLEMSETIHLGCKNKGNATLSQRCIVVSLQEYTNTEYHTHFWKMLKGRAQKTNFSCRRMCVCRRPPV